MFGRDYRTLKSIEMSDHHLSGQAGHPAGSSRPEADLLEEITYLQGRLTEMGGAGDCAYERALAGAFAARLDEHRRRLAQLRQLSR